MKFFALVGLSLSISFMAHSNECIDSVTDIVDKIKCLNDVEVISSHSYGPGVSKIELLFTQREDHFNHSSKSFKQRLVLLHRDISEPMLLQTSGYSIFGVRFAQIAKTFGTNQIQVEHRFFEKSIPSNPDFSKLNVRQSAHDFHRIVDAFKQIYKKNWVNTGASKGGMTSVYHRYFYPNDLDGTVADVAPLSFSLSDQRYRVFINQVGGIKYQGCRDAFKEMQILLLENASTLVPRINGDFNHLGSAAVAFEHSVIEAPFYFWQYGNPNTCNRLPDPTDVDAVFNFFGTVADVNDYTDSKLKRFTSYYFQAATELGNPGNVTDHLEVYRRFEFSIAQYTPIGVPIPYSNSLMRSVKEWVEQDANEMIFVYGEFDPWTAGEFPESLSGKEVYKFSVEAGNHSANFSKLDNVQKTDAMGLIGKWLGKAPVSLEKSVSLPSRSLEDIEFNVRKTLRL